MARNKFIFFILLVIIVFSALFHFYKNSSKGKQTSNNVLNQTTTTKGSDYKTFTGQIVKTIFIPYWNLVEEESLNNYERVIYFGLTGSEEGINKDDQGYQNLRIFNSINIRKSKKYLAIRLLDTSENLKILKSNSSMIRIIEQSVKIAKEEKFDGVLLDLEVGVLFGDDVKGEISNFSNEFYKKSKENNLFYSIAIYGDVFYRKRPYDISLLAKNSDELMIMAYDFHKSIGEPGPNFPLTGKEKYGYDMEKLMDDFLQYTNPEKLSVIFGMYGYDWIVDDQDRPIKPALSLNLNEIRSKHSNDCNGEKCEFIDVEGRRHVIWFENEESVEKKINYLKSRGIGNFAYWVYGYF